MRKHRFGWWDSDSDILRRQWDTDHEHKELKVIRILLEKLNRRKFITYFFCFCERIDVQISLSLDQLILYGIFWIRVLIKPSLIEVCIDSTSPTLTGCKRRSVLKQSAAALNSVFFFLDWLPYHDKGTQFYHLFNHKWGELMDLYFFLGHYHEGKHKQPLQGYQSPILILTTMTVTLSLPPFIKKRWDGKMKCCLFVTSWRDIQIFSLQQNFVWPNRLGRQNTQTVSLQSGRTHFMCVLDMTLNNLMVRFQ